MDIKLFTEFHKKKSSIKKHVFYGRLIFLLWYKVKPWKAFELSPFNTTVKKKKKTILSLIMEVCNVFFNNLNTFCKEFCTCTCKM